jgi:hypothetical protein
MTRPDSIKAIGLEAHVNEHCAKKLLSMRYKNFVDFVESARALGEEPSATKMARAFCVSRPTMDKWILLYTQERQS